MEQHDHPILRLVSSCLKNVSSNIHVKKFKREKCLFNFQISPSHKPLSHLPKTHLHLLTPGFVCITRIYSHCDPALVTDICRLQLVVNCDVNVTPREKKNTTFVLSLKERLQ